MEFNVSNCKILQLSTCFEHIFSYSMNGTALESVENHSYLGVQLHCKLSWSLHVNSICTRANRLIGFLQRNLRYCPTRLKETAYKHLVLPCLEYCASIWDPIQSSLIHQLEMVQHRAARFVLNRPWSKSSRDSVSQMLNTLNWTSFETRRRQSCLLQYYSLNFSNTWCMSLETVYQRIVQVELLEPVILFN